MTTVIVEVALTAIVMIIGSATLYIIKGFDKRLDKQNDTTGRVNTAVSDLKADYSRLEQRISANEQTLVSINKDIENLEQRNKDLMDKLEKNQEKVLLAIGKMELQYAEMTMQFKQADITHADIKGDLARLTTYLLGERKEE
jgi:septal ring factor EnvC (AmiA/AmiB activator)